MHDFLSVFSNHVLGLSTRGQNANEKKIIYICLFQAEASVGFCFEKS